MKGEVAWFRLSPVAFPQGEKPWLVEGPPPSETLNGHHVGLVLSEEGA